MAYFAPHFLLAIHSSTFSRAAIGQSAKGVSPQQRVDTWLRQIK
jgi:hypothetical protein